jgi:hypothetical protein
MPTDVSHPTTKAGSNRELVISAPYVLIGDPTTDGGTDMLDLGQVPSATIAPGTSKAMGSTVGPQQLADQVWGRGPRPEVTLSLFDAQQRALAAVMSTAVLPDFSAAITGVDTSGETVTVESDVTSLVEAGDVVTITESTGNDGDYVIKSLSYDAGADETTITAQGDITGSTADGRVIGFQEGSLFRSGARASHVPTLVVIPPQRRDHAIDRDGVFWLPGVTATDLSDLQWEDADGEDANNEVDVTLTALEVQEDQAGAPIQDGAQLMFTVPPWKHPDEPLDWHLPAPYDTESSVALNLS